MPASTSLDKNIFSRVLGAKLGTNGERKQFVGWRCSSFLAGTVNSASEKLQFSPRMMACIKFNTTEHGMYSLEVWLYYLLSGV